MTRKLGLAAVNGRASATTRFFVVSWIAILGAVLVPTVRADQARAAEVTRSTIAADLARATRLLPRIVVPAHAHLALPQVRTAIVGGTSAAQGNWAYMAFILHIDSAGNPDFVCSGTVVSPYVVMTAGHCGIDETTGATLDPSGFGVVTGSVDWSNTALRQLSLVKSVQVDPSYLPALNAYDAAMLVLSTPTTAPSIPLATNDHALEQGGVGAYIAGWGAMYGGGPAPVTALQWASTVVQDPSYCSEFSPFYNAADQLCAVDGTSADTATCSGDSGGPLVAPDSGNQPVEIGITSYGPSDCDTYTADYFTTVDPTYAWAQSVIQAATPSPPPPPPPSPSHPPNNQTLPRMTSAAARGYTKQTLAGVFGRKFKRGHGKRITCSRDTNVKMNCGTSFWYGPNDYWGTVTVWYFFGAGNTLYWNDKYIIHRVNDQCYFHSRHPHRCKITTRHGNW